MTKKRLHITLLTDNPKSWFIPYAAELAAALRKSGHAVTEVSSERDVPEGDIAFFLSCEQVVGKEIRARNTHNIVVHASALPHGKGWSPATWQILEGKNEIPLTLFEAADEVDAGDIYDTGSVLLEGHELIDEVRRKEGAAIIGLSLRFVEAYPSLSGKAQRGKGSFYAKRTPKDSELDPKKSLVELFEQLRVADNERYPAFFTHRGHTYILKIFKKGDTH